MQLAEMHHAVYPGDATRLQYLARYASKALMLLEMTALMQKFSASMACCLSSFFTSRYRCLVESRDAEDLETCSMMVMIVT